MRLTNTLTGQVQEFTPVVTGQVGLYVCGVTPYAPAHVGHAMSLMVYDVLVRYLRWAGNPAGGYTVTFASNYTDIDDKVIERAREMDTDALGLASANIDQWEREQELLGLTLPDVRPRVTQEIENIVGIISVVVNIVLRNRIDLYAASGQFESNRFNEAILRAARRAVRRVIRDAF